MLFLCSRNRRRSPTAERLFENRPGLEAASAGLAPDAEEPVTPDLLDWADLIFVMERRHAQRLNRRFKAILRGKKIVCLNIPDDFEYMEAGLMTLLETRVAVHLRR